MKTVHLRESTSQSELRVDADKGLIENVKVLGLKSVNNRRYTTEAVQEALPKYQNIKVNIDHPHQPNESRSLKDRFGKLMNVRLDKDGLRGDLIYNPAHPLAEAVAWFAIHEPDCLGLSHNAIGEGHDQDDGTFVVEKIVEVRSVDLVSEPATVKGLYEHKESMDDELLNQDQDVETPVDDTPGETEENYEAHIGHLVVAILQDDELSVEEKRSKVLQALKLLDDDKEDETEEEEAEDEDTEESEDEEEKEEDDEECKMESVKHLKKSKDKHVKKLVKSHEHLLRENKALKLCQNARIPTSDVFVRSLVAVKSEKAMKALIEDRKAVVNRPRSTGRIAVSDDLTAEKLVATLKGEI